MFKSHTIKTILLALSSALVLAACEKEEEVVDTAALTDERSILQYIPADSPYVLVGVEPLPDELMDNIEPKIDQLLVSYQTIIREAISSKKQEMSEEERNSDKMQRMDAVVGELTSLLSLEGLRGAGIDRESLGGIYGNGLLPVLRLTLSDGALFDDAIARVEAKAGETLATGEAGGQTYRYFDAEELKFIMAVINDQAVFTVVPANLGEEQIGQALGVRLPSQSIADSGKLAEIAQEYGYTNHFVGYIDVLAFVEPFIGQPTGLDAELFALGDHYDEPLSDTCKAEVRRVAGVVPRIVMGYTSVSTKQLDSNITIELRQDVAADLQKITAPVPGLGGDKGGLMSFGMSLDMQAFREFLEARLDSMEADPFECEHFADLQAGVAGGREALNQPLPPMAYDFKGFVGVIDDIQGLDLATQTPPTSIDGSFLLAMDNAQALVAMGTMFSPELAALNLQPDGKPVALDLPQLQAMGFSAFAALDESGLALGIGDDADVEIIALMGADVSDPAPFMSFSMDAARYYSFLGDAIAAGADDAEEAPSPEMQAALQDIMTGIAELYERMTIDIFFTARGIEFDAVEVLAD